MATIGTYGSKLAFSAGGSKIQTFRNMARADSGRYGKHELIGERPRTEFLGPDIQTISFSMDFYMGLGADPREMLGLLRQLAESGYHGRLVIGGRQVGDNEWTVTKVDEEWKYVSNKGELLFASAGVTMQEYR